MSHLYGGGYANRNYEIMSDNPIMVVLVDTIKDLEADLGNKFYIQLSNRYECLIDDEGTTMAVDSSDYNALPRLLDDYGLHLTGEPYQAQLFRDTFIGELYLNEHGYADPPWRSDAIGDWWSVEAKEEYCQVFSTEVLRKLHVLIDIFEHGTDNTA